MFPRALSDKRCAVLRPFSSLKLRGRSVLLVGRWTGIVRFSDRFVVFTAGATCLPILERGFAAPNIFGLEQFNADFEGASLCRHPNDPRLGQMPEEVISHYDLVPHCQSIRRRDLCAVLIDSYGPRVFFKCQATEVRSAEHNRENGRFSNAAATIHDRNLERVYSNLSLSNLRLQNDRPTALLCQAQIPGCRSKVRSSYSSKVESSCLKPANWRDEKTGDAGVKCKRSRSFEGNARS